MTIYFDMDGTIANLYGVADWLDYLQKEDTHPYEVAEPIINFRVFARVLHKLQARGIQIGIISWTAKNGSEDYNNRVRRAKVKWLRKHLPSVIWDEVHIVSYGTSKSLCGEGILFDDDVANREAWAGVAYDETNILNLLKEMVQ